MNTKEQLNRLKWRSRRGMLELDQLLIPFSKKELQNLSHEQQKSFETLLSLEDPIIYSYLLEGSTSDDDKLQQIIDKIIAFYSG